MPPANLLIICEKSVDTLACVELSVLAGPRVSRALAEGL